MRQAVGTSIEDAHVTYSYTANGKQQDVVDANGNHAKFTYDGFDRPVQWTFPSTTAASTFDGSTPANALATANALNTGDYEQYGYDANGNRPSFRRRDGRVFTLGYDALNRATSKVLATTACSLTCTSAPSSALRSVYYGYDLQAHQLYARFDSASGTDGVTSAYTGFGELASSTTAMGGTSRALSYLYDADGNRIRITHPDGNWFGGVYDGVDRLATVNENGGTQIVSITYDAQAHQVAETRGGVTSSYGYDGLERLASLADNLAGTSADVTTTFSYNPASQLTGFARDNDAYASTSTVTVNRTYAVNGLNQYTSAGPATFSYDANGNLTGDGTNGYVYDAENRLVGTGTGVALTYDPNGRLWQVSGGSGTTQFLYDGDQLSAEFDGSGNLLRRYVHGTSDDDPMVWYEGSGLTARRSLQVNWQGSIVSIADASGTLAGINGYDEYGIPNAGNIGRFQYTGQAWLPELGMYHYKARMYSPTLGRFLQTDPIGYHHQVNLYAYVEDDPLNQEDPSGECPWCVGAGIGAAIELGIQLSSSEGRAAYVKAGKALMRGDVGGAARAAGPSLAKVGVSAVAGATGAGIAAKLGQLANLASKGMRTATLARAANAAIRIGGNTAAGAPIGGVSKVLSNAIDRRPLGQHVGGAAIGGAIGGGVGAGAENVMIGSAQRSANASGMMIGSRAGIASPGGTHATAERVGAALGAAAEKGSCGHAGC